MIFRLSLVLGSNRSVKKKNILKLLEPSSHHPSMVFPSGQKQAMKEVGEEHPLHVGRADKREASGHSRLHCPQGPVCSPPRELFSSEHCLSAGAEPVKPPPHAVWPHGRCGGSGGAEMGPDRQAHMPVPRPIPCVHACCHTTLVCAQVSSGPL